MCGLTQLYQTPPLETIDVDMEEEESTGTNNSSDSMKDIGLPAIPSEWLQP